MDAFPPKKYRSWRHYLVSLIPGLALAAGLALLAWQLEKAAPAVLPFNYVIYAIAFGVAVKNLFRLPPLFEDGLKIASKTFLFAGVIFLGGTMNLASVAAIGGNALMLVAVTMTAAIAAGSYLGKKWGLDERSAHLVGAGVGVCGISAVMALAPVIKAREKHIVTAVAALLLNDIFILFVLPLAAFWTGITDTFAGYWAGSVASNTAQAIATGFVVSETAGQIATVTKTARNVLMAVVVLLFAYYYTRKGLLVGVKVSPALVWEKFPKFVLGFLLLSLLASLGAFTGETVDYFKSISRWMFAISFVAIGAEVNLREIGRRDLKPVLLGFLLILGLAVLSFAFIFLIIRP